MLTSLISAAFLAMSGAPEAAAGATAPTQAPAAEAKPDDTKRRVCKEVAPTGTRFAKKRCMSVAEYKRWQEEERRAYEEVQNRPVVSTARGS